MTATSHCSYSYETKSYTLFLDRPQDFKFTARTATREEAVAFAALFPKSAKLRVSEVSGVSVPYFIVTTRGDLTPNGTTGTVNETAVKRYRAIVKKADALGIAISYDKCYANSYPTRELFEAAL